MQRGKHFQKQPQEDRISGIKTDNPPPQHYTCWNGGLSYFRFPVKNHTGSPYINFALMNCGTFHAIFISFVNVTGLKP